MVIDLPVLAPWLFVSQIFISKGFDASEPSGLKVIVIVADANALPEGVVAVNVEGIGPLSRMVSAVVAIVQPFTQLGVPPAAVMVTLVFRVIASLRANARAPTKSFVVVPTLLPEIVLVKFGAAIAIRIDSTARVTSNSINVNPDWAFIVCVIEEFMITITCLAISRVFGRISGILITKFKVDYPKKCDSFGIRRIMEFVWQG